MKISPVNGSTTSTNLSNTGLSADKLARAKAIASGQSADGTEIHQDPPGLPKPPGIKMKTNFTTNRDDIGALALNQLEAQENNPPAAEENNPQQFTEQSTTAISDTDVQANEPSEVTEALSPQQVALAKQRRALQVKERELAERERRLIGPSRAELEARIKSQPLSVLQELGVTYDQLTQEILASQQTVTPEIQALKAEIQALKEGVDKTLTDKDAAAEQAVLAQMRRNVQHLSADEDFEMIRATGSQDQVVDLIHRTWKETGEVLDEAEAMRLVEDELLNDALKIAQTKKLQAKLTPPAPVQPTPQTGMRTLTNKDQARPPMTRRQRAIAAMLGQK